MPRPPQITRESLVPLIRAQGPVSATELAAVLRVNRTTITRILPDFGDELVTLGATRSTRYLLRRSIRHVGCRWPVFRIDESGRASEWAELEALHERSWRVNWATEPPAWAEMFTEPSGLWCGFPFFLGDVRPRGFLGRAIAGRVSEQLALPGDLRDWGDDDVLVYLQAESEDLPGDVVVGEECLRRALARGVGLAGGGVLNASDKETAYPSLAEKVSLEPVGSSAGGEQPKFLVTLRREDGEVCPVLVKFTAPLEQETGRLWADLLACEFHAHEVLADTGLGISGTRLLDAGGRRFLEVPRFDRRGAGGRMGVVSLEALAAASVGLARPWSNAAMKLRSCGLIDDVALGVIHRLQAFGELIGNSDMHDGNLAFFLGDSLPLRVTPAYDMLPMMLAPGAQGEIVSRSFAPLPPVPSMRESWREAVGWALAFWGRVAGDDRISGRVRRFADEARETLVRLERHVC